MNGSFEIQEYVEAGRSPFAEWFDGLDAVTAARVDKYIRRLEASNFGAAKPLREGVFELRLNFGPGYRSITGAKAAGSSFCSAGAANGGRTRTSPPPSNAGNDTNRRDHKWH